MKVKGGFIACDLCGNIGFLSYEDWYLLDFSEDIHICNKKECAEFWESLLDSIINYNKEKGIV